MAGQIYNWMNANAIDDIVVETHSFGGVVIRWILSNPTYDSRYQPIINRIRWVNSIAPPNKGSEAANLAGTLSGSWLTGWIDGPGRPEQQRHRELHDVVDEPTTTSTTSRARPDGRRCRRRSTTSPAPGSGTTSSMSEDYGLATLSGVVGMPGEDDGMVSQYSAQAVGVVWFTTLANHHHNRRNDYKKIGDSLATDF